MQITIAEMKNNGLFVCPCRESSIGASRRVKFALLFEGTRNGESNPSAITKLYNMLCDVREQRKHVVSGTGTRGCFVARWINAITGWDTYRILYEQLRWLTREAKRMALRPDQLDLYLFGFSRGAYQACLFAEMVSEMGGPPTESCCRCLVRRYAMGRLCKYLFKRTGFDKPAVRYIGVIDTVRSVLLWATGFQMPNVPFGTRVRHALAKHEARVFFRPLIVSKSDSVEQQCFLGSHGDVGWAYNGSRGTNSLGEISLRWLLEGLNNELMYMYQPPNPVPTADLMQMLIRNMWWVMHESGTSPVNAFGLFPLRSRDLRGVQLHVTAQTVKDVVAHFELFETKEREWILKSLGAKSSWFWRFLRLEDNREAIDKEFEGKRSEIQRYMMSMGT